MQFDTTQIKKAVDNAVAAEAQRLFDRIRADFALGEMRRIQCEARDPFFPREQVEDEL